MKILAIRGNNIASIKGEFCIDFTVEPLASSGIFAITGPTGSGKSTILDCICLALFAKTPRLNAAKESGLFLEDADNNKITQNDAKNLLRKGTSEGYAEVDFTSADNRRFRSRWYVRKARNKTNGKLQADNVTLSEIKTGKVFSDKKTETLKEIETLLGLNFEQFTRSVLLAQNDFTSFLKAENKEKAALLERLTGTEIYSRISIEIYSKFKEEKNKLEIITQQLKENKPLTELERQTLNENYQNKKEFQRNLSQQKDKIYEALGWYQKKEQLETSLAEADIQFSKAQEANDKNEEERLQLDLLEKIQPILLPLQNIEQSLKEFKEKQEESTNKKIEIEKIITKKEKIVEERTIAEENLKKEKQFQDHIEPEIEQAKKLDIQIQEGQNNLILKKEEVEEKRNKTEKLAIKIKKHQEEIVELNSKIEDLKKWFSERIKHKQVAEHAELITRILKVCTNLENDILKNKLDIVKSKDKLSKSHNEIKEVEEQLSKLRNELQLIQDNLNNTVSSQKGYDMEQINKEKEKLAKQNDQLEEIKKLIIEEQQTKERLLQKKEEAKISENKITDNSEIKENYSNELIKTEAALDQAKKMRDFAKIASTENVKKLREQLKENEPCPVCGSIHHANDHGYKEVNLIINKVEKETEELEKKRTDLLSKIASIDTEIKVIQENLPIIQKEIEKQETQHKEQISKIKQIQVTIEFNLIQPEIIDKLNDLINKNEIAEKKLKEKIEKYMALSTMEKDLRIKHSQTTEKLHQTETRIQKIKAEEDLLKQSINTNNKTLIDLNKELDKNIEEVTPYFLMENWKDLWTKGPIEFIDKIDQLGETWKIKTNEKLEIENSYNLSYDQLKHLQNSAKEEDVELNQEKAKLNAIIKNQEDLSDKRKHLIDGMEVKQYQEDLKDKMNELEKTFKTLENQLVQINLYFERENGILNRLKKDIEILEISIKDKKGVVKTWIEQYNKNQTSNLTEDILHKLVNLKPDWIKAVKDKLTKAKEELLRSQTIKKERALELKAHLLLQHIEKTKEMLENELSEKEEALNLINEELNELNFNIKLDEGKKAASQEKALEYKKQEQLLNDWSLLNDLIGSADGKSFQKIAQEYTLDILLRYANIHLNDFSGRYRLERITDTLGLEIIDQDMADEIRSVHTLSGGESFLVSLALALGLASLSSSKMHIESLFIDEGFGSLDSDTLRTAMSALEHLQTQGRKVGVITHVQEMTERIPVQIKLQRTAPGCSKIMLNY